MLRWLKRKPRCPECGSTKGHHMGCAKFEEIHEQLSRELRGRADSH